MQLIAADIGNSSIKVAVEHAAEKDRWCMESILRREESIESDLAAIRISADPAIWSISSFNQPRLQRLADWVGKHRRGRGRRD